MKPLTLEKTWSECLRMWKWIAKQSKKGPNFDVDRLKNKWTKKHHYYNMLSFYGNCFFCKSANNALPIVSEKRCNDCPARKVDGRFFCINRSYSFLHHPQKFYDKLVKLNKIRLARKKNKIGT